MVWTNIAEISMQKKFIREVINTWGGEERVRKQD